MLRKGKDRNQLQMMSLELMVGKDNLVRVVDAYVDMLDLEDLGFVVTGKIKNGAPAFPISDLLKLYYYGYLNRVRSSRRLEREAKTNIEAMWLVKSLQPGYKTIAEFRRINKGGLVKAFYGLNNFLKAQDLFDMERNAIDGSKFRSQNSKKNNYNEKKVTQHLDYIKKKTQEYLEELDVVDESEMETEIELEQRAEIVEKLESLSKRKEKYSLLEKQVEQARERGETQISTTDRDARALPKKMNIIEVSYNVLIGTDLKNKLITNFQVSNKSDTYALSGMALEAREVLEKKAGEKLVVLADKGFDTGSELKICSQNDVETLVAPKKRVHSKKSKAFNKAAFVYAEEEDVYICPQGHALKTNGKWYNKNNGQHRRSYKVQHYKLGFAICNGCPYKVECAGSANLKNSKGRYIERSEYAPYIEENIERIEWNRDLYRKRQQTVEHPFGTIKRQWGYDYTLLKTQEKVGGEFGIIFTAYNLRRAMSILGVEDLIKRLKEACLLIKVLIWSILSIFDRRLLNNNISGRKNETGLERLSVKLLG